ncbi:MAG TPA: glycosyltransferase family 2 protein [bacterium]|nr:glycosyltransferase family 2 protein [bacterium]
MTPKVDISVIITCFNKERFIDECIASIKRQSRQPKEVILIHDACDKPVAHAYAHTIILPNNVGVSMARDIGFKYSSGKLILFVDGDDVLSPDYLEKMALTIYDGADITYPDIFIWQDDNSSLSISPPVINRKIIKKNNKIPIPVTSLMHRWVYENLGGFRHLSVLEDLDFFVRALCKGYTMKKTETLLWYRRYEDTRNNQDLSMRKKVLSQIMEQLS